MSNMLCLLLFYVQFFMNEWLNEKAFESLAGKPLTIKTDQLDLSYSSNLSSPNTPLLQRSGSMSALVKETRNNPLESSGGLAGSAKKVTILTSQRLCSCDHKLHRRGVKTLCNICDSCCNPYHYRSN